MNDFINNKCFSLRDSISAAVANVITICVVIFIFMFGGFISKSVARYEEIKAKRLEMEVERRLEIAILKRIRNREEVLVLFYQERYYDENFAIECRLIEAFYDRIVLRRFC